MNCPFYFIYQEEKGSNKKAHPLEMSFLFVE